MVLRERERERERQKKGVSDVCSPAEMMIMLKRAQQVSSLEEQSSRLAQTKRLLESKIADIQVRVERML